MKPVHSYFGHVTMDLTECKVHCIDGELVAFVPKTWDVVGEVNAHVAATGEMVKLKQYRVTDWDAQKIGPVNAG